MFGVKYKSLVVTIVLLTFVGQWVVALTATASYLPESLSMGMATLDMATFKHSNHQQYVSPCESDCAYNEVVSDSEKKLTCDNCSMTDKSRCTVNNCTVNNCAVNNCAVNNCTMNANVLALISDSFLQFTPINSVDEPISYIDSLHAQYVSTHYRPPII